MMIDNQFAGLNGFVWWIGVVEDRLDPLKLGRCRVRIFGWHSEDLNKVPTELLPWAQAMMPLNNSNTYTPKESDVVVGFFLDGDNAQTPVMMGVLPGIPLNEANPQQGFNDTRDKKQLDVAPVKNLEPKTNYPRNTDEPTTSRLARNENPNQINLLNQLLAKGNKYYVAQPPSYNARYPYNNAIETESGHAFELDDTPNFERINLMHRTGSHLEFRPEGSVQQKIMGDSTRTIEGTEAVHIKGNQVIYIDGDLTYIVGGSVTYQVEKDLSAAAQNITFNARGSFSADAKVSASLSGMVSSSLGGLTSLFTSVDGVKTDISGAASLDASSFGKATFGGSATIVNGGTIALVNIPGSAAESPSNKTTQPSTSPFSGGPPLIDGLPASPFTAGTPNITGVATDSISEAVAKYGVQNPTYSDIIGTSLSNKSYLNDAIFGSDPNRILGSIATSPDDILRRSSFLDSDLMRALKKDAENGLNSLVDFGKKLPGDLYKSSGLLDVEKGYNELAALSETALASGKVKDYAKAGGVAVDLIGKGVKVGINISTIDKDVINASNFVQESCFLKTGKAFVKSVADPIIQKFDDSSFKAEMKKIGDDFKDLDPKLRDRLSELRKSIDKFDEKSLDEFIDANHKDAACQTCANEAKLAIQRGVDKKIVSEDVSKCLYREYSSFKTTYASKIPITDKEAADNLNKSC